MTLQAFSLQHKLRYWFSHLQNQVQKWDITSCCCVKTTALGLGPWSPLVSSFKSELWTISRGQSPSYQPVPGATTNNPEDMRQKFISTPLHPMIWICRKPLAEYKSPLLTRTKGKKEPLSHHCCRISGDTTVSLWWPALCWAQKLGLYELSFQNFLWKQPLVLKRQAPSLFLWINESNTLKELDIAAGSLGQLQPLSSQRPGLSRDHFFLGTLYILQY